MVQNFQASCSITFEGTVIVHNTQLHCHWTSLFCVTQQCGFLEKENCTSLWLLSGNELDDTDI